MGSQKRAKYTQKRKKKLKENAACRHFEETYSHTLEKISRLETKNFPTENQDTLADRIVELAESAIPDDEDFEMFQKVCAAVIMAWNFSIRGESVFLDAMTPKLKDIIRALAERKNSFFPDDHRFIEDYCWEDDGVLAVYVDRSGD
jgi:hypothetical protein